MSLVLDERTEARYTPTALFISDGIDLETWAELGETIGGIVAGNQWWAADWLVYGETHYTEEDFFQYADALGVEPKTLTNWRWIASRIPPDARRPKLSFSVHAETAKLDAGDRDKVLEEAESNGWTVKQTRERVRLISAKPRQERLTGDDDETIYDEAAELQDLRYLRETVLRYAVESIDDEALLEVRSRVAAVWLQPAAKRPRWTLGDVERVDRIVQAIDKIREAAPKGAGA